MNLGIHKSLLDRIWCRENQAGIEIVGNTHGYFPVYVAGLRLATATSFLLSTILGSISSSAQVVAAALLLTLSAATSFLVEIQDHSSSDSEKSQ